MCDMNAVETHASVIAFTKAAADSGSPVDGLLQLSAGPALITISLLAGSALLLLAMLARAYSRRPPGGGGETP